MRSDGDFFSGFYYPYEIVTENEGMQKFSLFRALCLSEAIKNNLK